MTSQDKLIKQGIKYTDALFEELSKRLANGVRSSDTLEDFLSKYKEYTDGNGENNPLVVSGYRDQMLKIILSETNNHRFSRPSQKEMVRVVIENRVGDLIVDVGEDVRENVRDIVKDGYNNELSQDEIAEQITQKVSSIKNRRARAIARTEIARTAVTSDYIISKERGATHFYVECRNTACPVCKQAWHEKWTLENDDTFNPKDTSAGGKGWIGDRTFSMNDVQDLPPKHPNCRCVPYFIRDKNAKPIDTTKPGPTTTATGEPTKEQLSQNLTAAERAKYANYKRSIDSHTKWLQDNPDAPAKQIEGHRSRLAKAQQGYEELRRKALGETGAAPKPTPKPKPQEPKPEPKKETQKPKETENLPNPTAKQLKENLTPLELKRYKRYLKEIKENKMSPEFIEMRKKEVENLKRKALGLKPLDNNTTILSQGSKEFGGRQLTAKELKSKLSEKQYNQFQKYSTDIIKYTEKLKKMDKDNPKRIPFEKKIQLRMSQLDRLEQEAITPTKVKSEPEKQKKTKPKVTGNLEAPFDTSKHLTKEQLDKMDFKQLAEHHGATYKGVETYDYDGKKYHMIEQTCSNGETFTIYFEEGAVKSYNKGGYATPNEIIHEVFKVPEALRKETNEIWFKNTQKGIRKNYGSSKYDSLAKNEGGYNVSWRLEPRQMDHFDDPDHKIVINPSYFKKGKNRGYLPYTSTNVDEEIGWKHAIFHEFTHSADKTRENWKKKIMKEISFMDEYDKIEKAEPYFTGYSQYKRVEAFAEHGGYIARMEANPSEQNRKITIKLPLDAEHPYLQTKKEITYDEYKKMYPKHYEYFMRKFKEGF